MVDFRRAKGGRWLVHYQDARLLREGFRDFGKLPLTGTEIINPPSRVQVDANFFQKNPCFLQRRTIVQHSNRALRLSR